MWLYLYTLNVMLILSTGLKIFEHSLNASEYKKFYHRTANFGPKPGQFNVSGRLQIMDPLIACGVAKYTNKTATHYTDGNKVTGYNQMYKDQIVLILRGNCTFSKKVSNAELLGATGVIVGDYNTSNDEWIVMSQDPTHRGNPITIPSVFVPHNTYQWILKLLLSYSSPLPMHDNSDGVYAILDQDCEYIAPTSTFWLAAFGIVIIVIPTLWCFIVCVALLRKKIVNYVQRSRRRQHLTQIPVVLYKGKDAKIVITENESEDRTETVEITAGSFSNNLKNMSLFLLNSFGSKKEAMNPHNDSCAICLEDFQCSEELRLLPCNHGFHKGCVDPWITKSSELCPMCKQSIFMNAGNEMNGCFHYVLKICCIANRRADNNDNDSNGNVNNDNDTDDTGIIVLAANEDELVPIDSPVDSDSDHLQSDNGNDVNQQ